MNRSSSVLDETNPATLKVECSQGTLKRIIEALLFASSAPISLQKMREIIETQYFTTPQKLRYVLESLQEECIVQQRAYRLEESDEGYAFRTCIELAPFVAELVRNRRGEKLTQASLEVLAIIAYKQPITKPEIEAIRGVDCSGIVQNLVERGLVEPRGRLEAPGRPTLFNTTSDFLKYFGLKDIKDLPRA